MFEISIKTFTRYLDSCVNDPNYELKCHGRNSFCKELIKFSLQRKGKINGYKRMFAAFKKYCLKNDKGHLVKNKVTIKQMRLIMKDHYIKGLNRSGKPYKPNEDKQTDIWTVEMDLIKNNYQPENNKVIWSMDIKYIATKEGWLYINAIREFNSQAIIGYHLLDEMTYENLILPSIKMAIQLYTKLNLKLDNIIIHTDNGKQYYAKDYLNFLKLNNMIPSKKQRNKFGGNALSENWFYHLSVEWIREKVYETMEEAKKDIDEYIKFYNYERIHSKWNDVPMNFLV